MENFYAIIQVIIASGVISGVVSLIFKRIIEGRIKLLFDEKIKKLEAELKLSTESAIKKLEAELKPKAELALDVGKKRIEEYQKILGIINSTRKFCQTIVIDSKDYDIINFKNEIKQLQDLINHSLILEIDNTKEKVHLYKNKLWDIHDSLNEYKTLSIENSTEKKNKIEDLIIEIPNDCKNIIDTLKTILKNNSQIN